MMGTEGKSILSSTTSKKLLHGLFGDYRFWGVYRLNPPKESITLPEGLSVNSIDESVLAQGTDPGFQERAGFGGSQAEGFGLHVKGQFAAIQWYWWGDRYWAERDGRTWILADDEVKSVGLYTVPEYRGQGFATMLKRYTAHEMGRRGFRRIYCRIWHSHKYSIAVSRKAGWHKVGSYIEIVPFGRRMEFRLPF